MDFYLISCFSTLCWRGFSEAQSVPKIISDITGYESWVLFGGWGNEATIRIGMPGIDKHFIVNNATAPRLLIGFIAVTKIMKPLRGNYTSQHPAQSEPRSGSIIIATGLNLQF